MTKVQEKAVELFVSALELALESGLELTCSVDISSDDNDSDRRCFGEFTGVNSLPSDNGFGSNEIQLLFDGSLST